MSRASRQDIWEPSPAELRDINPYEEARLYTTNAERERWEGLATLFGIIVSLDALERAYVREAVSEAQYEPACTRLLAQYKTIAKLTDACSEHQMDHQLPRTVCAWVCLPPSSMPRHSRRSRRASAPNGWPRPRRDSSPSWTHSSSSSAQRTSFTRSSATS
ncbi:hypothetical protein L7F22_015680 [Adiantum nelumboides]|nr:hypothetical protein [Adiantum nelumboides]